MKLWRKLLFLTLTFIVLACNNIIVSANEKEYITDTAYVEYIDLYYNGVILEQKGVRVIEQRFENIVERNTLSTYVPARAFALMYDNCQVLWNEEERKVTIEITEVDSYISQEYIIGSNIVHYNWIDSKGDSHKQTAISQNPIFIHNGAAMIFSNTLEWVGISTRRYEQDSLCYYDYRASMSDDSYYDYIDEDFLAELREFLDESPMNEESRIERYEHYASLADRRRATYKQYLEETYGETNVDENEWIALTDLSDYPWVLIHKIDNEWVLEGFKRDLEAEWLYSCVFEHILGEGFDKMYYSVEDCQDKFNGLEIIKRNNKYFLNKADFVALGFYTP